MVRGHGDNTTPSLLRPKELFLIELKRLLSSLGYCTDMVEQHGELSARRPTPHVDIKGSMLGSRKHIRIIMGLYFKT